MILAVVCGAHGAPYFGAEAQAATITLPKTGQTKCYNPTGATTNEVACRFGGSNTFTQIIGFAGVEDTILSLLTLAPIYPLPNPLQTVFINRSFK